VSIEVRPLPEEDGPAAHALCREAFGGPAAPTPADVERWLHTHRHSHGLAGYDGDRLVSHARVKPYRQWFGGRPVPMGGVASVAVAASHQRRGVARATVGAVLPLLREHGYPVSTLFRRRRRCTGGSAGSTPATTPGWTCRGGCCATSARPSG
jgi:predicted N-acetyltransferase YhbS